MNCKNCMSFYGVDKDGYGKCAVAETDIYSNTMVVYSHSGGYDTDGLAVHKDFGCIYFDEAPKNKKERIRKFYEKHYVPKPDYNNRSTLLCFIEPQLSKKEKQSFKKEALALADLTHCNVPGYLKEIEEHPEEPHFYYCCQIVGLSKYFGYEVEMLKKYFIDENT
jgi:hypothetical protein